MKISFDLDGVIASTNKWVYRMADAIMAAGAPEVYVINMLKEYYASAPLKFHPSIFMSQDDCGVIVTMRKPEAQEATGDWLQRHSIYLPIWYADPNGEVDWSNYSTASRRAGILKAEFLAGAHVDVHLDNNPYIVSVLREQLPEIKIIQIRKED